MEITYNHTAPSSAIDGGSSGPKHRTTAPKTGYVAYPVRVSRRWREGLLAALPALAEGKNAQYYRRMAEYLLYSSFRDQKTGNVVVPAEIIASLADRERGGFAAIDYLRDFSDNVWPLEITDYVPGYEARTVGFCVPDAVIALQDQCGPEEEQVWLVSGLPVSPTSRRKHADRYWEQIGYLADQIEHDHPAADLCTWLNSQPRNSLGKLVRSNYHRLEAMYQELPERTEDERTYKRLVRHTLDLLADQARMIYEAGDHTPRLTAQGLSIHLLPRAMRKAALAGATEMDMRSSQLAIVAKLWDLPQCREFLASGKSFWAEILEYLRLSPNAKPALKAATYSACYGMGRAKLRNRLVHGHGRIEGIGDVAARQFLRHPLISEILRGRSVRMRQIIEAGGVEDAFGRWLVFSRHRAAHKLLAVEAQSWELRLMMSVVSVVRDSPGTHVVSWLHDGLAVTHEDRRPERMDCLVRRCQAAFSQCAKALGFITELEAEVL